MVDQTTIDVTVYAVAPAAPAAGALAGAVEVAMAQPWTTVSAGLARGLPAGAADLEQLTRAGLRSTPDGQLRGLDQAGATLAADPAVGATWQALRRYAEQKDRVYGRRSAVLASEQGVVLVAVHSWPDATYAEEVLRLLDAYCDAVQRAARG